VFVSGSRGVIGKQLTALLISEGYYVIGSKRPCQSKISGLSEIDIEPWKIPNLGEFKIDLIIHLAATYNTKLSIEQIKLNCDSNIGLATSIAELASINKIPVIAFGTFVEKYPGINGLTHYANSRQISRGILYDYARKFNFGLDYVYMYDSYSSDISRGKFIDVLIKQSVDDPPIFSSEGYQVQDLVYVGDAIKAIKEMIEKNNFENQNSWQIRTCAETTLRTLSELISKAKGFDLKIEWGHFPYNDRDVFSLWDCAENLIDVKNLISLESRITEIITAMN